MKHKLKTFFSDNITVPTWYFLLQSAMLLLAGIILAADGLKK